MNTNTELQSFTIASSDDVTTILHHTGQRTDMDLLVVPHGQPVEDMDLLARPPQVSSPRAPRHPTEPSSAALGCPLQALVRWPSHRHSPQHRLRTLAPRALPRVLSSVQASLPFPARARPKLLRQSLSQATRPQRLELRQPHCSPAKPLLLLRQ